MDNKQCEKCEHSISNGWCKYPTCIKEPFPGRRSIDTKSLEYLIYGYEQCLELLLMDNDKKKMFYAGVASMINILEDVYDQSNGEHEYDYVFNKENLIDSIDVGLHAANMMMNRRKTDLEKAIEEVKFYQNLYNKEETK